MLQSASLLIVLSPLWILRAAFARRNSLVKLKIRNKTDIQSQIDFVYTIPYNSGYQSLNRKVFFEDWFLKIVIIIFQDFSHSFQYSYIILFVI